MEKEEIFLIFWTCLFYMSYYCQERKCMGWKIFRGVYIWDVIALFLYLCLLHLFKPIFLFYKG
jgi:hypothetical protein